MNLNQPQNRPDVATLVPPKAVLGEDYQSLVAPNITLHTCPGKEISWDDFKEVAPPFSIALDGFVGGAPNFDRERVCVNFNHHQDVDRLATRSTTGQVFVALKQGLVDAFCDRGVTRMNIFVNDPDPDSSLAVWLLANHERVLGTKSEPIISKLIFAEDLLDTTAGAYPFDPKSSLMQELAWIFEPYVQARMMGRIRDMQGPEMANVIDAVGMRVSKYSLGQGHKLILDTQFEMIGGGPDWRMIIESGYYARTGLFSAGIRAFVSFLGESNERYHYSIGKMSPYIPFPVKDIFKALNLRENLIDNSGSCWDGGDIIGGSPRKLGSSLRPQEVEAVINELLMRRNEEN